MWINFSIYSFITNVYSKNLNVLFGASEVEYLGHLVGKACVRVDPKNMEVMQNWPLPNTLKSLCGFLGLTGYYRKFFKNYGNIVAPLTTLLKKNARSWTPVEDQSFQSLKEAMCNTPVLALLDFTKTFILECDASWRGIVAVFMQDGWSLAFTIKSLLERHLGQSIYEKQMMVILHAVDLWLPCLLWKAYKLKRTIKTSSTSRNNKLHPRSNKNGWLGCLDMITRSFTKREKKCSGWWSF